MILASIGHKFIYEIENVIRFFFPLHRLTKIDFLPTEDDDKIITEIKDGEICCSVSISGCDRFIKEKAAGNETDDELIMARLVYTLLCEITSYTPRWGILTGVRPSKLLMNLSKQMGEDEAVDFFKNTLLVHEDKIRLAQRVIRAEEPIIALSKPNSYSLYISIPFCPTRCSYCSFVSHSIAQAKKLIPDYLKLLDCELEIISNKAKALGLCLETIYIGGGTPTSLSEGDLRILLSSVNKYFDVAKVREFTVEAGRPDTLNLEKLNILKSSGVGRISINPQTFSDEVLKNIGRNHTVADTYKAYEMAKSIGFDSINMDFIAGLPGETNESFKFGIDEAIGLCADNITVHTLALKRASTIVTKNLTASISDDVEQMLDYADNKLSSSGFYPYYMYRQSKSIGNNENVGWSKEGNDCLYNVYMMEEIHTVLAAGGGAVSRLLSPKTKRIERIFNFKYPYEYINRFDEMIARKEAIDSFYLNEMKG